MKVEPMSQILLRHQFKALLKCQLDVIDIPARQSLCSTIVFSCLFNDQTKKVRKHTSGVTQAHNLTQITSDLSNSVPEFNMFADRVGCIKFTMQTMKLNLDVQHNK